MIIYAQNTTPIFMSDNRAATFTKFGELLSLVTEMIAFKELPD